MSETVSNGVAQSNGDAGKTKNESKPLEPLSRSDFAAYNRMAVRMDQFHNYFRQSWNTLWQATETNKRPKGMSLRQFLNEGLSLARHLRGHHGIEEAHIFPVLAKRMPEFNPKSGDMVTQHVLIHAGLDRFEAFLQRCVKGEEDFEMGKLRGVMEGWGDVLWLHLDEEVRTLGAENMRKYWSLEEMHRMPM